MCVLKGTVLKDGVNKNILSNNRNLRYFRKRKKICRQISQSTVSEGRSDGDDNRMYAEVMVKNVPIRALMDSGANVSILGRGVEDFLKKSGVFVHSLASYVSTACGSRQRVIGYATVPVTYLGKTKYLNVFLVPSLQQEMYLGMDAWRKFGIAPVMVNEVSVKKHDTLENEQIELTSEQRSRLESVVNSFPNATVEGLGRTHMLTHHIDVGDAEAVKQKYYPVSPAVQQQMYQEIDRMLQMGVIQESDSDWSSPMALVKKPNGKIRLCLDARRLNEVTKKAAYPLPLIEGILSRLDRAMYISTIDLKDAFWQIPLTPESRSKTAFIIPGRPLYEFVVMPFGLCNAAQTLCKLVDKVIPVHLRDRVHPYIDDLLVTTETLEEHFSLLLDIADRLKKAGLTVNMDKSKFLLKEIEFLGYVVGGGSLRPNNEKIKAIAEFPCPKSVRQLRRFLGVTGWYRRFIANYSTKACALTDLLKGGKKFQWTADAQLAFEGLKQALLEAPVLVNPDFKRHFYIQCDACTTGIGSVLFQRDDNGLEHPIAFMSQKLNAAQRNYSITELECLAAVLSVKRFRAYVEGHPFTIITDHSSLKWLMSQRDLAGRLARWSLKLQSYDFKMEYRKGSQNVIPDALSRVYGEEVVSTNFQNEHIPMHIDLNASAFKDPEYLDAINKLKENSEFRTNLKEEKGILYINVKMAKYSLVPDIPDWKIVVPKSLTGDLIRQAHCPPISAHTGAAKTIEKLQRYFYWSRLAFDVRNFVAGCEVCKANKARNSTAKCAMGHFSVVQRPWQKLFIDFLGPYPRSKQGHCYILIILDQLSRFVILKSLRNATAEALVKCLENDVFLVFGTPEEIFTDNGRQFNSNVLKHLLTKYGVQHKFTPKYHPQSNASERVNRTILAAIRAYIQDNHKNWDVHLQEIAQSLRYTIHDSSHYSPHYIVFGQHQILHGSMYPLLRQLQGLAGNDLYIDSKSENLSHAQESIQKYLRESYDRNARYYNLRARNITFNVGQKVFVRKFAQSSAADNYSAKLDAQYMPAIINRKIGNVSYDVVGLDGKALGVYHTKDIKP